MKYLARLPQGKFWINFTIGSWLRLVLIARTNNRYISLMVGSNSLLKRLRITCLGILQNLVFGRRITKAKVTEPIFILGYWRTGTTLLHELMCCDPRFGFASTLACVAPHAFLLLEPKLRNHPLAQCSINRPMDQMQVSLFSPQEDEMALLAMGATSPYGMLFFPFNCEKYT